MPFGVSTEVKGEHGCQRSKLGEIKAKMKDLRQAKKGKKDPEKSSKELDTIVIQRLSAEFSGKAQKYSFVVVRELLSFEDIDELSISNIKIACMEFGVLQFGFQFGLYRVVAPLSFLRSISLASLFTSLSIFG